jgi:hypothetical protein
MSDSTRLLRGFIGMRIFDVRDNPAGTVLVLGPIGYRNATRTLIIDGPITELKPPRGYVDVDDEPGPYIDQEEDDS